MSDEITGAVGVWLRNTKTDITGKTTGRKRHKDEQSYVEVECYFAETGRNRKMFWLEIDTAPLDTV